MSNYNNFSPFYDLFTDDVDYASRTDYMLSLFERFDRRPTLLLDLACGTGNFSVEFAKRGIEVIGVDPSEGMLAVAQQKNSGLDIPVLYLCQAGQELELFGTVDGAVCCLDSLNHITDYDDFVASVKKVSLFLEPGRLFIFDMNTPYKHETVLGNNTFVTRKKGVKCVWSNRYNPQNQTVDMTLDITVRRGMFCKETFTERVAERAYSESEIQNAVSDAGLELLAVYGENTFDKPIAASQRNIYITRKG